MLIKLPQPGRLAVKMDLPEKPKKHAIHIELRTFDDIDWSPDRLRFHMSTFRVDNPGETVFEQPARRVTWSNASKRRGWASAASI